MSDGRQVTFQSAELVVDQADQRATLNSERLSLSPKAFGLLSYLMEMNGKLVEKEQLFEQVWPGVTVGDAALTTVVKELRQALGDSAQAPEWIETVRGKGYRFGKAVTNSPVEGLGVAPERSIGVLPFADLSDSGDQEYFADGVSEEILNGLAKAPGLRVAARTSSFAFRDKKKDIREIAKALNVATILEGSVRKSKNRLRITAQLIQASDGFHLWSSNFDGDKSEIFELQERVAREVAAELCSILASQSRMPALEARLTENLEAYELFLQARSLMHSDYQAESFRLAIEKLDQAVEIDPSF